MTKDGSAIGLSTSSGDLSLIQKVIISQSLLQLPYNMAWLTQLLGEYMYPNLIPNRPNLECSIMSLEGEERELFLGFITKMLTWWPKDRAAAEDLLKDPWLNS
jgi:hypothetical protein